MNYLQLATEASVRVGADTEDERLTLGVYRGFVKAGLRAIESDLDHPDWLRTTATISTVAGTGGYAVPATWAKTISLITDDGEITYMGREEQDASYDPTLRGYPETWSQEGGTITFRPIPDAVLTVTHRYVRTETDLTADADTPLLPSRFHDAVVEFACALAAARVGDYKKAGWHEEQYEKWIKKMQDEQTRVTKPPRTITSW